MEAMPGLSLCAGLLAALVCRALPLPPFAVRPPNQLGRLRHRTPASSSAPCYSLCASRLVSRCRFLGSRVLL